MEFQSESFARIKVVGVGGGGLHAAGDVEMHALLNDPCYGSSGTSAMKGTRISASILFSCAPSDSLPIWRYSHSPGEHHSICLFILTASPHLHI